VSVGPPAGNGTTIVTGRVGNVCAHATREVTEVAPAAASSCKSLRRRTFIGPSYELGTASRLTRLYWTDRPVPSAALSKNTPTLGLRVAPRFECFVARPWRSITALPDWSRFAAPCRVSAIRLRQLKCRFRTTLSTSTFHHQAATYRRLNWEPMRGRTSLPIAQSRRL
jgi:hypothetical protein